MSIKDRLAAKTATIAAVVDLPLSTEPRDAKTAPGAMMRALPMLKEQQAEIDALRQQIATGSQGGMEIPLEHLVEVPGRRRHMPPEKYAELRENLRHNLLVHPIVIRRTADGKFEIVSGHHRIDAYREIGRQTIRAVSHEGTDNQATDGAFFANLMQSDLTDYEKYVGLKRFQNEHTEMNQTEVASRVGISQGHLSALLSFDRLPDDAHSILVANKGIVGARAAMELAAVTETGNSERVVEAIRRLATGTLDQAQAVRFAREVSKAKSASPAAATYKVKSGKTTWCDVRSAKNVMRIEFQSEEIAQSVQEAIRKHLETLALQKR